MHSKPLHLDDLKAASGSNYPEPFRSRMGETSWKVLGDVFALTKFGIDYETLQPGAQSALRHWHTLNDEFVLILEGEVVLCNDEGETRMPTGTCMGFRAGDNNAHHLLNRSEAAASYIIIGSRTPGDNAFYPDDDLLWLHTEAGRLAVHKDGSPYEEN